MTEELKSLLGDGADAAGRMSVHTLEAEESPTVLKTDRWTKRTGERLAKEWAEAGVEGVTPEDVNLSADAIETLLSSQPTMAERPKDPKRARWWKQLMDSPETAALRARTVLQPAVAEIAAASLAGQYVAYAAETKEQEEQDPENESPQQAMQRIRSIRDALKDAGDAADAAEATSAGLGLGTGSQLEASKLAQYTRRLRNTGNLLAIMRMAGRFIARAAQLQRQRSNLPGMEITGVELSGDVARLLPYESALVAGAVPELELLAMARLTQRRSLSYRRILRAPMGMGPIVVSVDESGSMDGERIEAAKGLALAMASIARAQKRPFLLCAFSGDETIRTASGSPDVIVEWLEQFYGGGTVLDGPLHTLPNEAWPKGPVGAKADHIIITDANVGLPEELRDSYRAWAKSMGVRTFGIGVGVSTLSHLAQVCDGGSWCLPELDLNNPAIEMVLSIGPSFKEVR